MSDLARQGAQAFGARVRALRRAQSWTQDDLGRRMATVGYPLRQTTVAKLESAQRPTSLTEAYALAAVFGIDVKDLFVRQASS